MKKLFMIKVGGKAGLSNIEVHDIQFILAENIEETYEELKARWYGKSKSFHIDGYKVISNIDNYNIIISKKKSTKTKKLFFIDFGGYSDKIFGEIHKNLFILAEDSDDAKSKAANKMKEYLNINHIDSVCDVEENININREEDLYLNFEDANVEYNDLADWQGYIKLY